MSLSSKPSKPKVSIVTLTYEGLPVLKACVESLIKHCSHVDFEWIIRENGSKDDSQAYLEALELPNQTLKVVLAENVGNFSTMNNEVIQYCDGDYLLFLNNDITAENDFITAMVKVLDENPKVGAVLRYPDGRMQHCGVIINEQGNPWNLGFQIAQYHGIDLEKVITKDRVYQAATGACLMVRKAEFLEVGMFDPDFHWCFDDIDLVMKIRYQLNKLCVVTKDAQCIHHESWSKAKPANFEALRLLRQKHNNKYYPDYLDYILPEANEYKT